MRQVFGEDEDPCISVSPFGRLTISGEETLTVHNMRELAWIMLDINEASYRNADRIEDTVSEQRNVDRASKSVYPEMSRFLLAHFRNFPISCYYQSIYRPGLYSE